ncbi:OmpA family protein [Oceanivirga salmonicida]|uniref:OmpA family protein n=1 Tax=Oceanivirga salmonicida TaxID=1769291 RepID=UPI0012E2CC30|nr:OmpA family protein [Oceanivirga salmonicida]
MKNDFNKNLKRWLKGKLKVTQATIIAFLISGSFSMADYAVGGGTAANDAVGIAGEATGDLSIAIGGRGTKATKQQNIAIGVKNTIADGNQSIAIGGDTSALGDSSISIGGDDLDFVAHKGRPPKWNDYTMTNKQFNNSNVAKRYYKETGKWLVDNTRPNSANGTGRYINTTAKGPGSVVVGTQSFALGALSTAVGTGSRAMAFGSTAFGIGANANKSNSVALGAGSDTNTNAEYSSKTIIPILNSDGTPTGKNMVYDNYAGRDAGGNAINPGDQVSVGSVGFERQIKNVSPAIISATSTDAVNGSQLFSVANKLQTKIKESGWNLLGNGTKKDLVKTNDKVDFINGKATIAKVTTDGAKKKSKITFDVNTDDTTITVNSANKIKAVTGKIEAGTGTDEGKVKSKTGDENKLTTVDEVAKAINKASHKIKGANSTVQATGTNGETEVKAGKTVTIEAGKNLKVDVDGATGKFTLSTAKEVGFDKVTVGPVIIDKTDGINVGSKKITNVLAGTDDKDAVNVKQLKEAKSTVESITPDQLTVTTKTQADKSTKYEVGVKTGEISKSTAKPGTVEVKAGDEKKLATVDEVAKAINSASHKVEGKNTNAQVTKNDGEATIKAGDTLSIEAGKNLDLEVDSTGKFKLSTAKEVEFDKVTVGPVIIDKTNGINAGSKKITNVTAGTDDTDAVNVSQLNDKVANSGWNLLGNGAKKDLVKAGNSVDFLNGKATTAVVISSNGKTDIKYDINVDDATIEVANDKIQAKTGKIEKNADGTTKSKVGDENKLATVGEVSEALNNASHKIKGTNTEAQATGTDGEATVKAGKTVTIESGKNLKLDVDATGKFKLSTAKEVGFDKVTVGPVIIDKTDGINAGSKKITNVLAGTTDTDAVNVSQLKNLTNAAKTVVESTTKDQLEVVEEIQADKSVKYKLGIKTEALTLDKDKGTVNTPTKASSLATVGNVTEMINGAGFNLLGNGTKKDLITAGNSIDFLNGKATTAVVTSSNGKTDIKYDINVDDATIEIANDKIQAKTGKIEKNADGTTKSKAGDEKKLATVGEVSEALNNASHKIKGTNTEAQATGTDGVATVKAGDTLTLEAGKNLKLDVDKATGGFKISTAKEVEFEKVTVGPVIIDKTDGINAGSKKITNVLAGTADTDAVNVSQLKNLTSAAKTVVESTTKDQLEVVEELQADKSVKYKLGIKTEALTLDNDKGTVNTPTKASSLATVGNVTEMINGAGFNLLGNGTKKDLITAGNSIDFLNGKATTAVVTSSNGKTDIKYDINVDDATIEIVDKKIQAKTGKIEKNADGTTKSKAGDEKKLATVGEVSEALNNASHKIKGTNTEAQATGKDGVATVKSGKTVTIEAGKNLKVDVDGTTGIFKLSTAKEVGFDKVTVGNVIIDKTTNKITGLAPGLISATSTDAVNGSQLHNLTNTINNSGWNLLGNGAQKDLVKAGDSVDFLDGNATTAKVVTDGANKKNTITFDINTDNKTIEIVDKKIQAKTGEIEENPDGTAKSKAGDEAKLTTVGEVAKAINKASHKIKGANSDIQATGKDGEATVKSGKTVTIEAGKNLKVDVDAKTGKFTLSTAKEVDFDKVKVGDVEITKTDGINAGNKKITNVVAGTNDTDAVNVSQLNDKVANSGWNLLGNGEQKDLVKADDKVDFVNGNATKVTVTTEASGKKTDIKVDINTDDKTIEIVDNKIQAKTGKIEKNADGTTKSKAGDEKKLATVEEVSNALNNASHKIAGTNTDAQATGKNGETEVKTGKTVTIEAGKNLKVDVDAKTGKFTLSTAKEVDFDKVKVGDVEITKADGINAGNKKITNVAAGTDDTDAVNYGQLKNLTNAAKTVVESTTKDQLEVVEEKQVDKSVKYKLGIKTEALTLNKDKGTVNTPTKANSLATVGNVTEMINGAGFNLLGNGTKKDLITAGKEVNFIDGKATTAIVTSSNGKTDIKYDINTDDKTIEIVDNKIQAKTGKIEKNADGTTKSKAGDENKLATVGEVSEALNNASHKIAGTNTDTQATGTNGETEVKAGKTVTIEAGKNLKVDVDGTTGKFTLSTAKEIDFEKITIGGVVIDKTTGIDAGGKKISNVGAGTNPTDAVNVSQLNKSNDKLKGGVAGAIATAMIPQVTYNRLFSIGAGVSYYDKNGAIAVGISGQDRNKRVVYKIAGGVDFTGNFNLGAGINYNFGREDKTIVKSISNSPDLKNIQEQIDDLKAKNAELENKLDNAIRKSIKFTVTDFDLDKFKIKPEQIAKLKNIVEIINSNYTDRVVEIIGYTDTAYKEKYNLKLGLNRAKVVKAMLYELGLNQDINILIRSRGYNEITDGNPEKLRRVEILVNHFDKYN